MTTTENINQLAELNKFNQNYNFTTADYLTKGFDLEKEPKYKIKDLTEDFNHLKECEKAYLTRGGSLPIVGDALLLPTGETVYFCHIWDESAQTTGGGSYSLSKSGYLSYSGGLDSGVKLNDIYLTEDFTALRIWFCHKGYLTGGCAVYANIKTRVWKCKESADLSGVPQIERHYEKIEEERAETITRTNGNGQEYTLPLPKVVIYHIAETEAEELGKKFDLNFKKVGSHFKAQLMKTSQFEAIQKLSGFEITYYNNCSWKNTLVFIKN